ERRAVEREEKHDGESGEDGVRAEQVRETAREVPVRVERDAVDQVGETDSPDEGRTRATDGVRPRPERPPACALALSSPFERDDADDQEDEDEEQGDVETGEHRRVPGREGGEGGGAGDDEPHLVSVPDRADRLEHRLPVLLATGEEREEH